MTIEQGYDKQGPYFRNNKGHKFYYKPYSKRSKEIALKRAVQQMRAMYANGFGGK